jgi:hypothetical protein
MEPVKILGNVMVADDNNSFFLFIDYDNIFYGNIKQTGNRRFRFGPVLLLCLYLHMPIKCLKGIVIQQMLLLR